MSDPNEAHAVDRAVLETIVERLSEIARQQQELTEAQKEILEEAKENGLEGKIVRALVKRRMKDPEKTAQDDNDHDLVLAYDEILSA